MKRILWILYILIFLLTACDSKAPLPDPASEESVIDETSAPEETASAESKEDSSVPESTEESEEPESPESSQEEESEEEPVIPTIEVDLSGYPGSPVYDLLDAIRAVDPDMEDPETLYDRLPAETADCFEPLEGYLLPMVYTVEEGTPVLAACLEQSLSHLEELLAEAGSDLSIHELLTRASIVQNESSAGITGDPSALHPEVLAQIAAVVRNRIDTNMPLQMDATRMYVETITERFGADPSYAEIYNTYQTSVLPVGPIGCPTEEAVLAVLHPADTNDFFFVWDDEGNFYFAETYEEHIENCHKAGIY